jgi:hypothetical protein
MRSSLKALPVVLVHRHAESNSQEFLLAFSLFPSDNRLRQAKILQEWLEPAIARVDFGSMLYVVDSF